MPCRNDANRYARAYDPTRATRRTCPWPSSSAMPFRLHSICLGNLSDFRSRAPGKARQGRQRPQQLLPRSASPLQATHCRSELCNLYAFVSTSLIKRTQGTRKPPLLRHSSSPTATNRPDLAPSSASHVAPHHLCARAFSASTEPLLASRTIRCGRSPHFQVHVCETRESDCSAAVCKLSVGYGVCADSEAPNNGDGSCWHRPARFVALEV